MRDIVTIAIPTLTRSDLLERCLEALDSQTVRDFRIVVVDNGSVDRRAVRIAKHFPRTQALVLEQNLFFAGAANAGLRDARTPFVAVLNDDTEPSPTWLARALETAEADTDIGSVASKVLRYDNPDIIDSAGDLLSISGHAANRGWSERDGRPYDQPVDVFSASGCCALYRRSAFEEAGGFDPRFRGYLEDVDLGFRLQLRGYRCCYTPHATIRHHGGATPKRKHYALWLTERNMLLNLAKNMPASLLRRYAREITRHQARPAPVVDDANWIAWSRGKALASLRSPSLVRQRRHVQATRRASDASIDRLLHKAPLTHCHL